MDARAAFERHRVAVRGRLAEIGADATPDAASVTRKVNREIVVVAGWGRAILLQFAHPLIAEGVADHSHFGGSLLSGVGRLQATIRAMLALTFGDDEDAIAAAAGINTIHDRVHGRLRAPAGRFAAGTPYSAHDPDLLEWVHATLLDSMPIAYELLVGPLSVRERDQYCAEAAIMEPMLDIPRGRLPRNAAQLDEYMREMIGSDRVVVTGTSRALGRAVLYPPRWHVLWPAFRAVQLITIATLPPRIREAYGFRFHARDARAFVRWTSAIRHVHQRLPPVVRQWPIARRPRPAVTMRDE